MVTLFLFMIKDHDLRRKKSNHPNLLSCMTEKRNWTVLKKWGKGKAFEHLSLCFLLLLMCARESPPTEPAAAEVECHPRSITMAWLQVLQ